MDRFQFCASLVSGAALAALPRAAFAQAQPAQRLDTPRAIDMAGRLRDAEQASSGHTGTHVNVAIAYGGRHELRDAVRSLLASEATKGTRLEELAETLEIDHIADHLYTAGQPDPDLIIRTSGEQRLGGFLLWQSVHSEYYFCETYWPDFRRVDFLRALRDYAQRERRLGK